MFEKKEFEIPEKFKKRKEKIESQINNIIDSFDEIPFTPVSLKFVSVKSCRLIDIPGTKEPLLLRFIDGSYKFIPPSVDPLTLKRNLGYLYLKVTHWAVLPHVFCKDYPFIHHLNRSPPPNLKPHSMYYKFSKL